MNSLISFFLDLLFPPKCVFCHSLLTKEEHSVCSRCEGRLPRTASERRLGNGMRCLSPLRYDGVVRDSIHRFKFGGRAFYARTYAAMMAEEAVCLAPAEREIITWVPLSAKRLRRRGYDQAFLLARELGELLDCRPVPCLKKIRHTGAQSKIRDNAARRENVKNAYEAVDPENFRGKHILLVDDVVTTGSTLRACEKALMKAGAARVTGITAASAAKE